MPKSFVALTVLFPAVGLLLFVPYFSDRESALNNSLLISFQGWAVLMLIFVLCLAAIDSKKILDKH